MSDYDDEEKQTGRFYEPEPPRQKSDEWILWLILALVALAIYLIYQIASHP